MAYYNATGKLVENPFIYTPQVVQRDECIPVYIRKEDIKFALTPTKHFNMYIAKDDDCNIDIYIHANPKHLIRNIPKMIWGMRKMSY